MIGLDSIASFDVASRAFPDARDPASKMREALLLYFLGMEHTKFVSGHFHYSQAAYETFGDRYAFITMLRDPVKRWLSNYFYNRYGHSSHRRVDDELASFLESPQGISAGSMLVKFIGGAAEDGDYASQEAIERAKENLHKFRLVGFLDNQGEFLRGFQAQFGVTLKLEHRNESPTPESLRQAAVSPEIIERVGLLCQPDIELHTYAREVFAKTESPAPQAA